MVLSLRPRVSRSLFEVRTVGEDKEKRWLKPQMDSDEHRLEPVEKSRELTKR